LAERIFFRGFAFAEVLASNNPLGDVALVENSLDQFRLLISEGLTAPPCLFPACRIFSRALTRKAAVI
jgi:hypothetical protein